MIHVQQKFSKRRKVRATKGDDDALASFASSPPSSPRLVSFKSSLRGESRKVSRYSGVPCLACWRAGYPWRCASTPPHAENARFETEPLPSRPGTSSSSKKVVGQRVFREARLSGS